MKYHSNRIRVDEVLVLKGLAESTREALALLMAGDVLVDDKPVSKPGELIDLQSVVRLRKESGRFVSRSGEKLAGAHLLFKFEVTDKIALDVGISTGGFTDFLIQNGAKSVFGVDVGYGQVAMKLQINPQVAILERMNARHLTPDAFRAEVSKKSPHLRDDCTGINLVVMDLSFISVRAVLPAVSTLILPGAELIIMLKPQFEGYKHEIEPGGVVRNPEVRAKIIERTSNEIETLGFHTIAGVDSTLAGTKGNLEYFLYLRKSV